MTLIFPVHSFMVAYSHTHTDLKIDWQITEHMLLSKCIGLVLVNLQIALLSRFSHVRPFATLWTVVCQCPWDSPGQNTRVGSLSLLQWIFPTQGANSSLPHCIRILYQLSHQGRLKVMSLLFNVLSRFVRVFLSRSKCLLI